MDSAARRFGAAFVLMAAAGLGCQSGPPISHYQVGPECETVVEHPGIGAPAYEAAPEWQWSEDWYDEGTEQLPGTRQVRHAGKLWPPYPRPMGKGQKCAHKFHTAHYWPWPYNCWDRAYVETVLDTQVANGWITECTLMAHHFDPVTQELNHAGRHHLRWILQAAPPQYRFAWIQAAEAPEINQVRLANVQSAATLLVGEANVPPVMVRVCSPTGRPASEINEIRKREIGTMPDPRVKYRELPTGVGTGG